MNYLEKILNQLKNSIKEPVLLGEDYYTGEGWEEPNFFCLDPTTNDCKTLFDYITNLQQELTKYKNIVSDLKFAIKSNCIKIDNKYQEICCDGDYLLEILEDKEKNNEC